MKPLIMLALAVTLSGCATTWELCIPSPANPDICHPQKIKAGRQVESVDVTYSPSTGDLSVKLKGVAADPMAAAMSDVVRAALPKAMGSEAPDDP